MRYFTQQIWRDLSIPLGQEAWNRNFETYKKSLDSILPGLSSSGRRFFSDPLILHDGALTRMEVGDRISDVEGKATRNIANRRELIVRLFVLSDVTNQHCYILEYRKISKAELNFPGPVELFGSTGFESNFGDWGYDELSADNGIYRHEILFSSGATVLIEFKSFSMRREKAT